MIRTAADDERQVMSLALFFFHNGPIMKEASPRTAEKVSKMSEDGPNVEMEFLSEVM